MRIPSTARAVARLHARPRDQSPSGEPPRPGTHRLGIARTRDGLLFVPRHRDANLPHPLILLLHGAGADAADILPALRPEAERAALVLLVPDSRGPSWDLLAGALGPDVAFIDRALASTFRRIAVDPAHLAIAGFSDGGSYALSLGLANGDLFSHVIGFSPGFVAPPAERGHPSIFIAHGRRDRVLPIDRCGRRIVSRLESAGYPVTYVEFDGGHAVPRPIVDRAVAWMLDRATTEDEPRGR